MERIEGEKKEAEDTLYVVEEDHELLLEGEEGEEDDAGLSEEDTPVAEARYVHVNNRAANAASGFPTNMTSTTKYTWWNFLFKNLYEQFRRVANSYFLLVMSIQLIPGVAPITPLTSILPLLFVLCVTAAKDAWDDWNRRKADNEVNNRTAAVCERGSIWKDVAYRDIVVGDLIKIHDNEEFPADIVLLKSAASDHQCFIETSNLDGETTKKIKRALAFTSAITESELAGIDAVVECDAPNIHLDSFNGKFTLKSYHADAAACAYTLTSRARRRSRGGSPDGDADLLFPLNEMHLLPRGARLVNTASIIGVVVYTGRDTKLMLNQQPVPLKFSFVERTTNKLLIALVAFVLTLCLATAALSVYWTNEVGSRVPYLMLSTNMEADLMLGVRNFLTLFVLFNTFLPISLYVTIEFVKTLQAYFLANDLDLYDERSDQPVIVKTTSLLEDLGQVEYVFSDKTGTLTENKLVLKKCSIRGMLYDASGRPPLSAKAKSWHRDVRSGDADDDAKCGDDEGDEGDDEDSDAGSEYGHGINCDPDDGDTFPLVEGETRLEDDLLRPEVDEFLLALALCHSAFVDVTTSASTTTTTSTNTRRARRQPQQPGGEAEKEEKEQADEGGLNEKHNGAGDDEVVRAYQASSPDDEALVLAAARYGVVLTSRVGDRLTVRLHGRDHVFQVLAELPFDSDRKRMSVIVRTPSGEVRIYCKGAETVVLPRLKHYRGADSDSGHTDKKQQQQQRQPESAEWACIAQTEQHINHYARQGLRTLLVSMATLEPSRCDEWLAIYRRAAMAVHHRKAKLAQAAELIEQELHLLGATAIEDKLQKGVPETLRDLGRAGIKVWVLTGDKQETAINIGYSAHVLDERMELITINVSSSQACQEALAIAQDRLGPPPSGKSKVAGPKCALVVDGQSLTHALADHKTAFREVAKRCQSVICCRVSAKQKAEVVGLVKDEGHVTLAIGDGANDVSMIRRAHVGIGIIGKEGSQASRSSDYAIAQFRFLKKLLLVHGRYAYLRIATLIQYYFYKNATFTLPQVYFSFFNGFSGQTLFDSWIIVLFNIVFTSMPILLVGLWDRDVPQEALLQFPRLYSRSRSNQEFNFKTFSWWLGSAVLHSALIFYFAWSIANTVLPNGHPADLFLFGVTISTSAITIVTFKLAIETSTWTVIHHVVFWGSLAVYFVFLSLYGLVPRLHHADNHIYWAFFTLFRSTSFWLTYLTLVVCSLLPDLVCKSVVLHFCPGEWRVMREYWLWMRPRQRRAAALYGVTAPSVQNRSETRPLLGSAHEEEGLG